MTHSFPTRRASDLDGRVRIQVLEGRLGDVAVQGAERYRPHAISAPTDGLRGRILRKDELDTALLYVSDLPGVSTTSVLQPDKEQGETELVVVATEDERPMRLSLGRSEELTYELQSLRSISYVVCCWNTKKPHHPEHRTNAQDI